MSARAARPRSRRGRHAPHGEVASGSSGPQQPGPSVEWGSQDPGSRALKEAAEDADGSLAQPHQHPEVAAPQDGGTVPPGPGAPDVFQTLQSTLASLEAAFEGVPGPWQEAARLAEKNAWLQLALDTRKDALAQTQAESDTLRQEVRELQDSLRRLETALPPSHSHTGDPGSNPGSSAAKREAWGPQGPAPAHPLLRRLRSDPSAHWACVATTKSARLCPSIHTVPPASSSVDTPTPQEVAAQLQGYVRHLRERRALLKVPPEPGRASAPRAATPHTDALVQAILEAQPGPALPRLKKTQIQQDLVATRVHMGIGRRVTLCWRDKTLCVGDSSEDEEAWPQQGLASSTDGGLECRAWDQEKLAAELASSLQRAQGLQEQLQSLQAQLEQVARRGRAGRVQSAELSADLCRAHSALVLGFRGAHRKQEEQRRKLAKQMAQMEARQAEELAGLEATAHALGKPRPWPPLSPLGETLL
ncbi:Usher syndrome type-1C protein-binding protein 1 [Fukomys damarensis]|uniref:Usher syndrome type-1C protein-binding protein 1 n=1 Tax=Fukomys damarensis TaxID=885580 RepID=UPI00145514C8|nr:Usher syndrome type-1C protein-binding protein 1 [Fukomys damarensis]